MTTRDLVVYENELRIRHVSADIVELFECILRKELNELFEKEKFV